MVLCCCFPFWAWIPICLQMIHVWNHWKCDLIFYCVVLWYNLIVVNIFLVHMLYIRLCVASAMEGFMCFTMFVVLYMFALYHSLGIWTLKAPKNLECQGIKKKITKTTQEEKGFVSTLKNIDKENYNNNIVGSNRSCTMPSPPLWWLVSS